MIPCERRPIARPIALHRVSTATMQQLVVLCGLVGSGKSTFARAVEQHDPNWTRCNQDELGRRQVVEKAALAALDEGRNVLIDRTNINRRQRADWLLLADEFRRRHAEDGRAQQLDVALLFFDVSFEVRALPRRPS